MAVCSCGASLVEGSKFCPQCGKGRKSKLGIRILLVVLFLALFVWIKKANEVPHARADFLRAATASTMSDIYYQVANDAVSQYEIAKRSGTKPEVCFHAGMVAAAYLQAKDEPNYKAWKATEKSDCK